MILVPRRELLLPPPGLLMARRKLPRFPRRPSMTMHQMILGAGGGGGSPAPVFNAVTSTILVSGSSRTFSHTTGGSNRALVAGFYFFRPLGTGFVNDVTYAGVSMTQLGSIDTGAGIVEQWALSNPANGANNVIITFSESMNEIIAGAISFTGAHQTTASLTGTWVSTGGQTTSPVSVDVVSAANEIVVDVAFTQEAMTVGSGQTSRWERGNDEGDPSMSSNCGGSTEAGAGTVTMSWTFVGTQFVGLAGVSVKPP